MEFVDSCNKYILRGNNNNKGFNLTFGARRSIELTGSRNNVLPWQWTEDMGTSSIASPAHFFGML